MAKEKDDNVEFQSIKRIKGIIGDIEVDIDVKQIIDQNPRYSKDGYLFVKCKNDAQKQIIKAYLDEWDEQSESDYNTIDQEGEDIMFFHNIYIKNGNLYIPPDLYYQVFTNHKLNIKGINSHNLSFGYCTINLQKYNEKENNSYDNYKNKKYFDSAKLLFDSLKDFNKNQVLKYKAQLQQQGEANNIQHEIQNNKEEEKQKSKVKEIKEEKIDGHDCIKIVFHQENEGEKLGEKLSEVFVYDYYYENNYIAFEINGKRQIVFENNNNKIVNEVASLLNSGEYNVASVEGNTITVTLGNVQDFHSDKAE